MSQVAIQRNIEVVTTEIITIKQQTMQGFLQGSIEIGRRLVEAKEMVPHGEWGTWLKDSVDFSQSTANNMMRLYESYGDKQMSLFEGESQALGNLSYTQAVALLAIPDEEREQFIEENNPAELSSRELQKLIKEHKQLQKKLQDSEKLIEQERQEKQKQKEQFDKYAAELAQEKKNLTAMTEKLKSDLQLAIEAGNVEDANRLQKELDKSKGKLQSTEKRVQELEQQLKEKPKEIIVPQEVIKVPEEVEAELAQLRAQLAKNTNVAVTKFEVVFKALVDDFNDLLSALNEIKEKSPDEYPKYKTAVSGLLSKMAEPL